LSHPPVGHPRPAGHLAAIILLITAGVVIAVSLAVRPPADTPAAARRLALALALMFALSPATRFGYFAYPLGLLGWIALSRRTPRGPAQEGRIAVAAGCSTTSDPACGFGSKAPKPGRELSVAHAMLLVLLSLRT
jgi:hypothetical protein